jgi:hypothetical protein
MDIRKLALISLAGVTVFGAGVVYGRQAHMESALDHLRSARSELNDATGNKGGHKAKAIRLVNEAIDEVRAGISYAD